MTTATIDILTPDDVLHSYSAEILEGDLMRDRAARADVVETAQVQVMIDVDELVGASSPLGLPAGRYRARVRHGATTLLDGATSRTLIAAGPAAADGSRTWVVTVQAAAAADLGDRLDAIRVNAPSIAHALHVGGHYQSVVTQTPSGTPSLRWYRLPALLTALLAEAGTTLASGSASALFAGGVRYFNTDIFMDVGLIPPDPACVCSLAAFDAAEAYSDGNTTLPDMSARDLWDALVQATAVRVDASYAAWPSLDVVVTLTSGRWDDPGTTGPALDERMLDDAPYDLSMREPQTQDFALVFEGDRDTLGTWTMERALALYGTRSWRLDGRGEPANAGALRVPLRHPRYTLTSTAAFASGSYNETTTLGRPILADAKAVYLAVVRAGLAVVQREPTYPATGAPSVQLETWAVSLHSAHAMKAFEMHECRGSFDVDGLAIPDVGALAGVVLEEVGWRVEARAHNADLGVDEMTLVRVSDAYTGLATMPPARPLAGVSIEEIREILGDWYAVVQWKPPVGTVVPSGYDFEVRDLPGGTWTPATHTDSGAAVDLPAGQFQNRGYRVRAVYGWGVTSEWVEGQTQP